MARPQTEGVATLFGRTILKLNLDYQTVAKELHVGRPYVGMLARGEASPGPVMMFDIRDWAVRHGARVPLESWENLCRKLARERRKRRRGIV